MAQLAAPNSTLASAPSIVGRLVTEPPIADDQGPVATSMFFGLLPDPGDVANAARAVSGAVAGAVTGVSRAAAEAVTGAVIQVVAGTTGGQIPAEIMAEFIPSITEIVQAGRAGTVAIPRDQMERLAVNSPEFYCVVGAVAGATEVAPPHVLATQAQEAHRDLPSQWYVNFPRNMSGHDVEAVRRNRKSMMDFRSWSSKKWWEEVGRRYGVADDAIQRARQSKQFAEIACEDMVKMSW